MSDEAIPDSLKAEALERLGNPAAATALRIDSAAWARYGFGPDSVVKARMRDIAAATGQARAKAAGVPVVDADDGRVVVVGVPALDRVTLGDRDLARPLEGLRRRVASVAQ